jgi:hypothetical protein
VAREAAFDDVVRPFLVAHCTRCHGSAEPKGELSLEKFATAAALLADRAILDKVQENLRLGVMPPEGEPRPPEADLEKVVHWIREEVDSLDRDRPPDPGRVTLRRLNRAEYNNTIRDLVGIDFAPADDFPQDEVGNGFDNMGDVLAMSPLLFEKYLAAAEKIASRAIVLPADSRPRRRIEAESLERDNGAANGEFAVLVSNGALRGRFRAREKGSYRVRVRAYGDQAGDEPPRMAIAIDGQEIAQVDVTSERASPAEYTSEVALEEGRRNFELRFLNDFYQPEFPDANRRDRNLAVDYVEIEGPLDGIEARLPTSSPAVRVKLASVILPAVVSSMPVTLPFQSVTAGATTRPVKSGVVAFTLGSFTP